MLLYSHHLYAVISVLDDAREDIVLEFGVCAHTLSVLCHTDMALVDEQRIFLWAESFLLPYVLFGWSPYLGREDFCDLVLYYAARISWYTLSLASCPFHFHLVQVSMVEGCFWQLQFPVPAVRYALECIPLVLFPVIEVSYKVYFCGIGSPLAEDPSASCCAVESKI